MLPRRQTANRALLGRIKHPDAHPGPPPPPAQPPVNFSRRGGTLSKWHPNYEFRPGQVEMAEAVESALADKRHLIVEAGTGTGKTLAYLVPALLSGKRIVVSTGTKNLQEQLFFKDVPFLQQHFARPLKVCYMKGRNNYACRQKIYDAENEPVLTGLEEVADFQIIREWEKTTEFGDRAEIKTLPEAQHRLGQGGRAQRAVHRAEVPAIRALLHHPDAPAGAGERHHHRQPPPVLRRPRAAATRTTRAASCPSITPWSSTRRTRSRTWSGSISACRSATTGSRNCGATSRWSAGMKKFGTPELDRILERLDELQPRVLRPVRRGRPARGVRGPRRLPRGERGGLRGPARRARTDRLAPQAAAESARGDHSAVPPRAGTERRACAS